MGVLVCLAHDEHFPSPKRDLAQFPVGKAIAYESGTDMAHMIVELHAKLGPSGPVSNKCWVPITELLRVVPKYF